MGLISRLTNYLHWIHAGYCISKFVLSSQKMRPRDNDGRIKLTDCHVKHAVSDKPVFTSKTRVSKQKEFNLCYPIKLCQTY